MNIAFFTVIFLILVVHLLLHVVIRKESKLVFWLSTAFSAIFVAGITVRFDHHFGDLVIAEGVRILVMVVVYAVADQLFNVMVKGLYNSVEEHRIEKAVEAGAQKRATEIIRDRDEQAFEQLLNDKLASASEKRAAEIVASRDAVEFNRTREEQLNERVEKGFEQRLSAAIEAGAREKLTDRLQKEVERIRNTKTENALWVALAGTNRTVGDAFGIPTPQGNMVLAVPYWIFYNPSDNTPRVIRFSSSQAYLIEAGKVSFVSNRWHKVEGSNQIVLDEALVNPPTN